MQNCQRFTVTAAVFFTRPQIPRHRPKKSQREGPRSHGCVQLFKAKVKNKLTMWSKF